MIPEALTAPIPRQRHQRAGPCSGTLGEGPLLWPVARLRAARGSSAHRQRGAPPWRGVWNVALISSRTPVLAPRHRTVPRPQTPGSAPCGAWALPLGSRGSPLDTDLLHDPLLRTQIDLLDNARLALDAGGADPVKIRSAFFPLGNQAWHRERVIRLSLSVQKHL